MVQAVVAGVCTGVFIHLYLSASFQYVYFSTPGLTGIWSKQLWLEYEVETDMNESITPKSKKKGKQNMEVAESSLVEAFVGGKRSRQQLKNDGAKKKRRGETTLGGQRAIWFRS